jgi:hypothetical protein
MDESPTDNLGQVATEREKLLERLLRVRVLFGKKSSKLLEAPWVAPLRRNARMLLALIGVGSIAGLTRYPEFFFLLGVFALHGKYFYRKFEELCDGYSGARALKKLRNDWHAPVSAFDVFNGRQDVSRMRSSQAKLETPIPGQSRAPRISLRLLTAFPRRRQSIPEV